LLDRDVANVAQPRGGSTRSAGLGKNGAGRGGRTVVARVSELIQINPHVVSALRAPKPRKPVIAVGRVRRI
jgi:hypothetical protein